MSQTKPDPNSPDYVNSLPLIRFGGEINVLTTPHDAEECARMLCQFPLLGFDTETKPNFKKGEDNPMALLQLATDKEAFLFRIRQTGIPPSLRVLMQSPQCIKIGVGIKDDLRQLTRMDIKSPDGFYDLGRLASELGMPKTGLRYLSALLLERRLSKNEQRSNWDIDILSLSQKIYAATDAWVCMQLYRSFETRGHLVEKVR